MTSANPKRSRKTEDAQSHRLQRLVRTRIVEFWGHRYRVTPRLVNEPLGDGKQLIWVEPMDTRPDYYILRVDSSWSTRNSDPNPVCDHLNEIYDAIENQFGRHDDEYESEKNGRTYVKHWPFPALNIGTGCCQWGGFND